MGTYHDHDTRDFTILFLQERADGNHREIRSVDIGFRLNATDEQVKAEAKGEMGIAGVRGTWTEEPGAWTFRPLRGWYLLVVTFE